MPAEIATTIEFDAIRVAINGVTHLRFKRSKLLCVQSWIREPTAQFFIEFTFEGGVTTCDYDGREKWQTILKQLDEVL